MADIYEYEMSLAEVWEHCVLASAIDVLSKLGDLIIYNTMFNIMTQSVTLSSNMFHGISLTWGLVLLGFTINESNVYHFIIFLVLAYGALFVIHRIQFKNQLNIEYATPIVCITYLFLCEFLYPDSENWMQSRGIFMVATMKIISLSSDFQSISKFPTLIAFFGYICCPANVVFGPWIPFREYIAIKDQPRQKNIYWILAIINVLLRALVFLSISNCWGSYLIPHYQNKWLVAYRQAQSFRTSHYFISYLSEASMIIAGYSDEKHKHSAAWGYDITYPLDIEIPSSLVSVVISWNIPMHKFLKKYVYRSFLQFGHFKAILTTYIVSSLLHGFNVEIAAVLLTIGLYSYIQLKFQDKLALELNSCLKVRLCKSCNHKYKRTNILVKIGHMLFSCLTIFNLIYLGVLMDAVGYPDSLSVYSKWEKLDFLSHWIMIGCHVYTII